MAVYTIKSKEECLFLFCISMIFTIFLFIMGIVAKT